MNFIKRFVSLLIIVLSISSCSNNPEREITVLSLNIWQEGTVIEGGYNAIVDEVERLNPDFVTFSEVRNYNNTNFSQRIIDDLLKRGLKYYSFKSFDSGLLSKFPIKDSSVVYPLIMDHGTIHKLVVEVDNNRFAIYTAHLDYLNCAYYLTRGYDGNSWKQLDNKVSDIKEIKKMNLASKRHSAISTFLEDAKVESEKNAIIILGGDFNEPSMLDWTEDTKNLFDHNGIVYDWDVSKNLLENNFKDSYREKYPSVTDYPGFTYPSTNTSININKLTWAPNADERERIDFIYYKSNDKISLKDIKILGPSSCIKNSEVTEGNFKDKYIAPKGIWPTDHKGLFATFKINSTN